ncbi:MAG: PhoH family protein [Abitibacteriaceae bacterium]|nr:PhoH family protein [Abditibacteriaceae bacterium]MBV9865022.1 PhoH family protein [Abditibacteriaceae bacterium]
MDSAAEISVTAPDVEAVRLVLGRQDETRRLIERELAVTVAVRDGALVVSGQPEATGRAAHLIEQLLEVARRNLKGGRPLEPADVRYMVEQTKTGDSQRPNANPLTDTLVVSERGKPIGPRTAGQKTYVEALRQNELVFAIGPAGTGKTYLAVAAAVAALKAKQVARIILTRPAVEAGERLGFLPGDLEAKIDPYLRPLYDALYDLLDMEKVQGYLERRTIEVAPLAYMRGRTLNDSYVILDEAQNTTPAQMKMFLTRLGFGSRMVVTGDVTQTDLPAGQESGLRVAARILTNVPGIQFVRLGRADVVRHNLVQRIIEAYEKNESTNSF